MAGRKRPRRNVIVKMIVKSFFENTIGENGRQDNMCFASSYALSLYLAVKGVPHQVMVSGNLKKTGHYWLRYFYPTRFNKKNNSKTIIDLTLNQDQFRLKRKLPCPYFGKTKRYYTITNQDVTDITIWSNGITLAVQNSIHEEGQIKVELVTEYLRFSTKIAILLIEDIEHPIYKYAVSDYLKFTFHSTYYYPIRYNKSLFETLPEGYEIFDFHFSKWKIDSNLV